MEYIGQAKEGGCFICEALAADPSRDRENLVLERGKLAVVMMNRYPYNNGHLMVAPVRHGGDLGEKTPDELAEMMALTTKWRAVIAESMGAEGFNIGMNLGKCAGAGLVDHLHMHLVPRLSGDTKMIPVIADVHVGPQALAELYDQLQAESNAEGRSE